MRGLPGPIRLCPRQAFYRAVYNFRPYPSRGVFDSTGDLIVPMVEDQSLKAVKIAIPQAAPRREFGEGPGPFLEGGDIVAHGKDVIVGEGDVCSNRLGAGWLARYLAPEGYRVHSMPIKGLSLRAFGRDVPAARGPSDGLPASPCRRPSKTIQGLGSHRDYGRGMQWLGDRGCNLDAKHHMIGHRHGRIMGELDKRGIKPFQ